MDAIRGNIGELERMRRNGLEVEVFSRDSNHAEHLQAASRESTTFPPMGPGFFSLAALTVERKPLSTPALRVGYFSPIADKSSGR